MSDEMADGFNFATVDAKKMKVKIGGQYKLVDGSIVVADTKEAYGGDAKTIASMAAETVARVTEDVQQADRAYDEALKQAEQSALSRLRVAKTKAWQVKNRIADATLEFDAVRNVWYLRYIKVNKETGFVTPHYRELSEDQMDRLGQRLMDMGVE